MFRATLLGLALAFATITPAHSAEWVINVTGPTDYQTFQRDGANRATFTVRGWYVGNPRQIQASWKGQPWVTIDSTLTAGSGSFQGTMTTGTGQGTLQVRFSGTNLIDKVYAVGVGDIFVMAGQSNMMGYAPELHQYAPTTIRATMLTTGNKWAELRDPYSVLSDPQLARGSFVAWIANAHLRKTGVPLGVIPAAKGGSNISQWSEDGSLYTAMRERVALTGGKAKAVLWFQGESDAQTPADTYADKLSDLADDVAADFKGAKLVPAIIGPHPTEGLSRVGPRIGTVQAVEGNDHMVMGPAVYDVNLDDEGADGVHFQSDRDLATAGHRFWLALDHAFYGGEVGYGPALEDTSLSGSVVSLDFDTELGPVTATPEAFWVHVDGVRVPVQSVSVDGDTVNLTLEAEPVGTVTVSYGHDNRSAIGRAVYNPQGLPAIPFHNVEVGDQS